MSEALGHMEGDEHVIAARVYYQDTDAAGVVYHANYLDFAERGRNEFIRHLGFDCTRLRAENGMVFVIRSCRIDYLRPGHLDDLLEIRTRLVELGGATMRMAQRIARGDDDLARLDLRVGCVSPDGRPARMPAAMRSRFQDVLIASTRN